MRIAKPLLVIITPLGVAGGLREAYRFGGGGLLFLMIALLTVISVALLSVVRTVRRERAEEAAQRDRSQQPPHRELT